MLFTTVLVPVTPSRLSYSLPKSFHFLPQFGKIVKILELSLHFPMANTKQIGINNAYKDAFKKSFVPRYLEIQSSGRQDVLRVHYSPVATSWTPGMPGPPDQDVRVETFPLRLADDSWHRLAVIVSGDQIEVSWKAGSRTLYIKWRVKVIVS